MLAKPVAKPIARLLAEALAIFHIVAERSSYLLGAAKNSMTATRVAGSIKIKIDETLRGRTIRVSIALPTESV